MEALKQNTLRLISFKKAKKLILIVMIAFLFDFSFFSMPVLADEAVAAENGAVNDIIDQKQVESGLINNLPENNDLKVKYTVNKLVTAYNSEPGQCDNSPCITANGFNVCEHGEEDTIAANFLKFGTKVRIPELYGDKIFIVRDRMNARYSDRIDIWMIHKQDARNFGVKTAMLEILE